MVGKLEIGREIEIGVGTEMVTEDTILMILLIMVDHVHALTQGMTEILEVQIETEVEVVLGG